MKQAMRARLHAYGRVLGFLTRYRQRISMGCKSRCLLSMILLLICLVTISGRVIVKSMICSILAGKRGMAQEQTGIVVKGIKQAYKKVLVLHKEREP